MSMDFLEADRLILDAVRRSFRSGHTVAVIYTGPDITGAMMDAFSCMPSIHVQDADPKTWSYRSIPWRSMVANGVMVVAGPLLYAGSP
jgi:hypothetical protein